MYEEVVEFLKQHRFKECLRFLNKELKANPLDTYLLTQKANVLWNMGRNNEAVAYAVRAEEMNPEDGLAVYTAGRILWSVENYEESRRKWKKILGYDLHQLADNGYGLRWALSVQNDARYYLADCLYHLYLDAEALDMLEKHISHRRKGVQSDFTMREAQSFQRLLRYSSPRGMDDVPTNGCMYKRQRDRASAFVDSLKERKDYKRLIRYLKRKSREYLGEYWLLLELAELLYGQGNRSCLRYAEKAMRAEPDDLLVIYNYACALYLNEQYEEANVQLAKIISEDIERMAYGEHGEGMRWAKRIVKKAETLSRTICSLLN